MKQSDKMTDEDRVEKREDSECESKVEVGRVNAQKHTASNQTTAPSRMRQQSIHVSLCSTKNMRWKKKTKKELKWGWKKKEVHRGGEEVKGTVFHLPAFATKAMKGEALPDSFGMPGLLLVRRGLKSGCCGDATLLHPRLLLGQLVYSPKPHKASESHRTRDGVLKTECRTARANRLFKR